MVFSMKQTFVIFLASLFSVSSLAQVETECEDVNIGSMGMAWSNLNGKLFSGVLVCTERSMVTKAHYLNGYKHGSQITYYDKAKLGSDILFYTERRYVKGVALEECKIRKKLDEGESSKIEKCRDIDCVVEDCR